MTATPPPVLFICSLRLHVTELVEFAERGHSMTVDSGGRDAESYRSWLRAQGL